MTEPRGARLPSIRDIATADHGAVVALTNAHKVETSELDREGLEELLSWAAVARCLGAPGALAGFVIAMNETSGYTSPNFLWFKERYGTFLYVDRIITAPAWRGRGIARRLYTDLIHAARRQDREAVVAEVNLDPPNPGSDAFHAAMGFAEVGRAFLAHTGKTVRYLRRAV